MSVETDHKDDRPVRVQNFVSQLRDHAGGTKDVVSLVTNMTEQHKVQASLQRWNIVLEQALKDQTRELRQLEERLRRLTTELNLTEQRERKRLANELHDHLQQMLVVGKLAIGQSKRFARSLPECEMALKKVDAVLSDALTYSRTLVAELSPPVLHDHGLAAGLKWLAEYMKKKHEQAVTVVVPDDQDLKLPEEHVVLLFQSVRELLINSSKHAGTSEATVRMEQRDDHLQIEVRDEGAGFDLAAANITEASSGGISSRFGLLSIQERMWALGGSFAIDSTRGQGTTARLSLRLARGGKDSGFHFQVTRTGNACAAGSADDAGGPTMRTEDLSGYCS